jgi:hypothetical protein
MKDKSPHVQPNNSYLPRWLPPILKTDLAPSIPDKVGLYVVLVALALLIIGGVTYLKLNNLSIFAFPSTYEECVAQGNPILLSYPSQCTSNGRTFIQPTSSQSANPR